jgi:hypothetical protein
MSEGRQVRIWVRWALVAVTAVVALLVTLLFAPVLLSGTRVGDGHSHTEPVRPAG